MRYWRSSPASFFNFAGVSPRRSAGELIAVSSGYGVAEPMERESTVKGSVLSEHQPVRSARQRRRARAENSERRERARMQFMQASPRRFDADAGRISRLVVGAIGAGSFAEQRRVAFDVQQIVLDLEREADGAREFIERLHGRLGATLGA